MSDNISVRAKYKTLLTGIKLGSSTFVKLLSALLITKLVATQAGLGGFGLVGQFQSVMSIIMVFAGGGISAGVVRYVAELRQKSESDLKKLVQSSSFITIAVSVILALLLIAFSSQLSEVLFKSNELSGIFIILAASQFLIGYNNLFIAITNGYNDVDALVKISILGSVTGLLLVYLLSFAGSVFAIIVGLIVFGVASGIFSLFYLLKRGTVTKDFLIPKLHSGHSLPILKYSLILLVSSVSLPVAQIIIRGRLYNVAGWENVGYWQGVMKVSDAYIQFITVILANYFYPKYAASTTKAAIRSEVMAALKVVIPSTMALGLFILLFRGLFIQILFSESFAGMRDFFPFQILGDTLKIACYTILYVALAKGLFKTCILAELLQSSLLIVLSIINIKQFGPLGVTYAYAETYFVYLVFAIAVLYLFLTNSRFYREKQSAMQHADAEAV